MFAKLGGRWLSNILHGGEIDNPDIVMPKAWVYRDTTPDFTAGGAALSQTISLPEFITNSNIISWHVFLEQNIGGVYYLAPVKFGEASDLEYEDMEMTVILLSGSRIRLQGTSNSTDAASRNYMLTVFFK